METIDNRTFKEKFAEARAKAKIKIEDTICWIKNNPTSTVGILAGTAAILKTTYKIIKTGVDAREAKERKKEVYCNDIQQTVKLRKELNYFEARELRDRMNSGQSKFEALDEMGLLLK